MVSDLVMMDMRYPGQGPQAPTGKYKVRMIVDEDTAIESFSVLKDPRWKVTDHEFQLNFDLAQQIGNLIEKSQNQIKNLRSIRQQVDNIAERSKKAGYDSTILVMARDLELKMSGLEDLKISPG